MDREANFLRCSKVSHKSIPNLLIRLCVSALKLSCYAEFNRMVQVVAKIGSLSGGGGHKELQRGG